MGYRVPSMEEIATLQRMGIDQTYNLEYKFGMGEYKVIELAKIDMLKQRVDKYGRFYISQKGKEWLIVQMFDGGEVFKVKKEDYCLEVRDENILVTDLKTDEEFYLIDAFHQLDWHGMSYSGKIGYNGKKGYTYQSTNKRVGFEGYPAVRFGSVHSKALRVHWIIALMNWGIEPVAKCVGYFRTHELHHLESFQRTGDNSISNLSIMDKALHQELHGYWWRDRDLVH